MGSGDVYKRQIGLKNNLFQKMSERSLNSKNDQGMKELAEEYKMGISTVHGAESFYEFFKTISQGEKGVCLQW